MEIRAITFSFSVILCSAIVVPTKSDSDVISFFTIVKKNINFYTPFELTRIERSLEY